MDAPKPPLLPANAVVDGWLAVDAPKGEAVDLARPLAPTLVANGEGPPCCVALPKFGGACEVCPLPAAKKDGVDDGAPADVDGGLPNARGLAAPPLPKLGIALAPLPNGEFAPPAPLAAG